MTDKENKSFEYEVANEISDVASVTECTGLMPTPPQNSAENEAYSEICIVPNMMEKAAPSPLAHTKRREDKAHAAENSEEKAASK